MAESVAAMLLRAARVDAAACKVLDAAAGMPDAVVGFHAQQACEKCFKSVLGAAGIEVPRSHDLARLMDLLAANSISVPVDAQWVDELYPYAVEARYGLVDAGCLDRHRTLVAVDLLLDWAQQHLAGPIPIESSVSPESGGPGLSSAPPPSTA